MKEADWLPHLLGMAARLLRPGKNGETQAGTPLPASDAGAAAGSGDSTRAARLCKPFLCVHAFALKEASGCAAEENNRRKRGRQHLEGLWGLCERIGMTEGLEGSGFPIAFPAGQEAQREQAPSVQAFRRKPEGKPEGADLEYAYVYDYDDIQGIMICLADNKVVPEPAPEGWSQLERRWRQGERGPRAGDELLGEVRIFGALYPEGAPVPDVRPALAGLAVRDPDGPRTTRAGLPVWEGTDPYGRPVLAVLAPEESEALQEEWVMKPAAGRLPPLAIGLVYRAKLQYEAATFHRLQQELRTSQKGVDERLGELVSELKEHVRAGSPLAMDTAALARLQNMTIQAQIAMASLDLGWTLLKELKTTVSIARGQMERLQPEPRPSDGARALFAGDVQTAGSLLDQIRNEIEYAEAVRARAQGFFAMTTVRMEAAAQANQRRQNELKLLETSLLGAVGLALAALQALPGSAGPLKWPLVLFLAALGFALPALIARSRERNGPLDYAGWAVLGGSGAWLADRYFRWDLSSRYPWWPVTFAVLIILLAIALTHQWDAAKTRVRRSFRKG